ncbi:hypothetical protein [Roseomonas indoligenes]|uniref:General stress protein 17M-like domain-containing protein n=1 Tax=Roseomonas indoligenes TaxID=2820811 RepID=A0A940MZ35_9PROT|nr:hypothetical protein [Pararoseomonas indoligenes]MBP0496009.1 hypothetical protein [Pararoseomonas indoligenes]
MATRTITGLFDTRAEAELAVEHLIGQLGLDRDRILLLAPSSEDTAGTSLGNLFMPEEDRVAFAEGIRRGGYVVSAEVDEFQVDHAMDVFEQHGAVDLDAREADYRSGGWTGYTTRTDTATLTGATMGHIATSGTIGTAAGSGISPSHVVPARAQRHDNASQFRAPGRLSDPSSLTN